MNVVFLGAGKVFGYHASQFMGTAPIGTKFYAVEPNDSIAALLMHNVTRITYEKSIDLADLVIVMTPSYLRWELCKEFILDKVPLIIEKPLTINWKEISLFEEAAKKSWICPIVNARLIPRIEKMKNEHPDPKIIKSWKNRNLDKSYYTGWHGKFATDGGVLAQQGFHCLDLVCWIGGNPISVTAKGSNKKHLIECEDTCHAEIKFENGAIGIIDCTTAGKEFDEKRDSRLAGLDIDGDRTEAFQFVKGGKPGHTVLAEKAYAALAKGDGPPVTVTSMVPSLKTLHACYVSMDKKGEEVLVGTKHGLLGE